MPILSFQALVFWVMLAGESKHDFHTSITQMQYNAPAKTFEVSLRVFTDDLERALNKDNNGQKFTVINKDKNDAAVERYVRRHFALITPKNQKKPYSYIGKENEADGTWVYLEIPCAEALRGFSVQNDVLMDLFDDQTNLLNLTYLGSKKTFVFKPNAKIQGIEL